MADKSKIQWCDATIGPAYGCSPVSPACDHCYAARMAGRLGRLTWGTHRGGRWTGTVNLFPERMDKALRWRKPRRVFVGSMTDLFHEAVPDAFLNKIIGYMAVASWHTFILLTKRPKRMREYFSNPVREKKAWTAYWEVLCRDAGPGLIWPLPNIILMTTIEDQPRANERMPHLMALAGMGWKTGVSVEPMLGPVDLRNFHDPYNRNTPGLSSGHDWLTGEEWSFSDIFGGGPNWIEGDDYGKRRLHWVICGCESGPHRRCADITWVRSLRDQCVSVSVPFFLKQIEQDGEINHTPELDGQTWTQFPEVRHG